MSLPAQEASCRRMKAGDARLRLPDGTIRTGVHLKAVIGKRARTLFELQPLVLDEVASITQAVDPVRNLREWFIESTDGQRWHVIMDCCLACEDCVLRACD